MYLFAPSFLNGHFLSTNYLSVTQVDPGNPEKLIGQCGDRQEIVPIGYEGLALGLHRGCSARWESSLPSLAGESC